MERVVLNLKTGYSMNGIKNGDIIVYDATKKDWYITTPETFFAEYDEKFAKCIKRYDEQVESLQKKIQDLQTQMDNFLELYKKTNEKLIAMVENQINDKGDK